MSDFLPDPPRWKERPDQANLAEREAGRAIRFMATPEPLPAAQLTRIAASIRAARPRWRYFWLTVTAALLLCGATVASAAHLNVLPSWFTRLVKPRPAETAPGKRASLGPSRRTPAPASAIPTPAGLVNGGNSVANDTAIRPSREVVRKWIGAAPAQSSASPRVSARTAGLDSPRSPSLEPATAVALPSGATLAGGTQMARIEKSTQPTVASPAKVASDKEANSAQETSSAQGTAKYLSEAIHALRVERSPGTALFLLDRHATQLSKSAFAHEALLLRVEAMLALGRKDEVLRLLDGAALTDVAASRSLLVTRGELRAAANRCADGLGDFDLVLARSKQADRQALFGRAMCRNKLGDSAGAQADVERYRREFPTDPRLSLPDLARQVAGPR
jgi:hypothetical protein